MRATVAGLRLVVIRDALGLPAYACTAREFHVDASDWTVGLRVQSSVQVQASYFNRRNSHWEPLVEPWRFGVHAQRGAGGVQTVDVSATDRLLVNASHAAVEETLAVLAALSAAAAAPPSPVVGDGAERMPYVLVNRTGIDCHVWVDLAPGAAEERTIDTAPVLLRDGASLPWRFEDWRRRRAQVEAAPHHVGIQFANGQWEWLRRVQVDRAGVRHYALRPALDGVGHRLAVDVRVDARSLVKRVVLRSALVVENRTRAPVEVAMCDYRGALRTDSAAVAPGDDLPLPILFCHQYAVRVRPPGGAWSGRHVFWRDFLAADCASVELSCAGDPPFHVHVSAAGMGSGSMGAAQYKYPRMRLVLAPPLEVENLLPYAVALRVLDKSAGARWAGRLERGAVAAVHAVRPGNLVLLSAAVPDAGFDRCDGAVVETPDDDEYPLDDDVVVSDRQGARLALRLHRMDIATPGARCRRISIYAPYVMVNRTGLRLTYSSKGLFKGVSAVAGQDQESIGRPLMFSFGSFDLRNRALVRVPGSEWSRPLSFDALGSCSEVVLPLAAPSAGSDQLAAHLGLSVEPGRGRYSHTRVATFTARYVVKNATGLALRHRQPHAATAAATALPPAQAVPLHTLARARRRLLTIALGDCDRWSAPFAIDDVGRAFVRLPAHSGAEVLVRIDVVLDAACLFVILQREEPQRWPYAVANHTLTDVTVWQHIDDDSSNSNSNSNSSGPVRTYVVRAGESLDYAWDVPTAATKLLGVASTSGLVAYAMNVLTMAIGNINEAPVSLNALVMQNVRVSMPVLLDRMHKHYSAEVFNQVYKVLGSANLLGNPVGLFNNISSGVTDFFYEPYQGFVMSDRPQDFGFGLARGTASLFKKTVYGMTDSFSKFTDSMSKGLSAATMDPRYQSERSLSRVRNKPKHAIYGVARGAESLAKSVTSGLAGVVMRPLEGAEQEGVGGFFKGVGKGLVGVVTKPVIGMFDLASTVTEGIRNTTTVFERDLDRQRLPRHIGRDGIITAYSGRDALGQAWMRELSKGAYARDCYLAHLELPGSDMVVLLTYQRLVMFRRAKPDEAGMAVGAAGSSMETGSATGAIGVSAANASKAQIEWEQEIRSLHSVQLESTGISLKLPATPEGYVPPGPFIPIADAQSRRWFYEQIKEAVKALIDHRKELG
ncbi:Vacuolar protein sorting-associated protein 13 [Coemansia sp. RSA 1836]|nr:Vacuolar protein sorting-associated protein 13 [Coemansia sp. RSA 1836]